MPRGQSAFGSLMGREPIIKPISKAEKRRLAQREIEAPFVAEGHKLLLDVIAYFLDYPFKETDKKAQSLVEEIIDGYFQGDEKCVFCKGTGEQIDIAEENPQPCGECNQEGERYPYEIRGHEIAELDHTLNLIYEFLSPARAEDKAGRDKLEKIGESIESWRDWAEKALI